MFTWSIPGGRGLRDGAWRESKRSRGLAENEEGSTMSEEKYIYEFPARRPTDCPVGSLGELKDFGA